MNITEPIRKLSEIQALKNNLTRDRDKILFTLGINTGLRVSDLIKLKVSDVKPIMTVQEKKTGKTKSFQLSDCVYQQLVEYIKDLDSEWLFPSRKGNRPITTVQAWRIINEASVKAGLEHIGTHSMRKTFGYHLFKKGVPLELIQKALNHSSQAITMLYIGITQDELNQQVYSGMDL